jgi:glyoxylase I family protein
MGSSVEAETDRRTIPPVSSIHHIGITVSDVEASEAWYRRVLGFERLMVEPHNGGTGFTVLIHRPGTSVDIGLDHHDANEGETFAEHRTGLDHLSINVDRREDLNDWVTHLDHLEVPRGEITDRTEPFPFSTLVFRDPDNIQLELIWLGSA